MSFLAKAEVDQELLAIQRQGQGAGGEEVLRQLVEFLGGFERPLQPSCAANYRRTSWQDAEAGLRVTLDEELSFYTPTPELWERETTLTRDALGISAGREQRAVIEVKHHGQLAAWLPGALAHAGAQPTPYSKFTIAARAVHGT
jgi:hypothetical protein